MFNLEKFCYTINTFWIGIIKLHSFIKFILIFFFRPSVEKSFLEWSKALSYPFLLILKARLNRFQRKVLSFSHIFPHVIYVTCIDFDIYFFCFYKRNIQLKYIIVQNTSSIQNIIGSLRIKSRIKCKKRVK